jgi:hypothetical protein
VTVLYLPHMKETQMKRITGYVVFKIDREGVGGHHSASPYLDRYLKTTGTFFPFFHTSLTPPS